MKEILFKMRREPYVTVALVVINAVIFLVCFITGDLLYDIGKVSPYTVLAEGRYYNLLTSMFLHADMPHLVNNMLLLLGLGYMMERELGHLKFFILYILTGLGAGVASIIWKMHVGDWMIYSIGASGAVYGMLGVLLTMCLFRVRDMENVNWRSMLIMIVFSIYCGFSDGGIDNTAHIGGAVCGLIFGAVACLIIKISDNRKQKSRMRQMGAYWK